MAMVEQWTGEESGVLHTAPLLLTACRAGAFGSVIPYDGGRVLQAHFTFLEGEPDEAFFRAHPEQFLGKYLVCMSLEWEQFLQALPMEKHTMRRRLMKPRQGPSGKVLPALPEGYTLSLFDEAAFAAHPFSHGAHYDGADDFARRGSGAVVRYGQEIVASASSFLTYEGHVELDVSTSPEHRRKGLADHCVAAMMDDCAARGLTVHWDAMNDVSSHLAASYGFVTEQDYAVNYLLPEGEKKGNGQ